MRLSFCIATLLSLTNLQLAHALSPKDEFVSAGCPKTTKPHASHAEQRAAWSDFADILYTQKRVEDAFSKYVATGYINHAAHVAKPGANGTLAYLTKATPSMKSEVHHLYVGWDKDGTAYGTAHLKATNGTTSTVVVDMIRFVGTCLVEHWDALQTMGDSENPVAYF